ncbi:MFS transporter (plasmid) [Rhodococcus qingshengii]|uniref:MFS transporter n=1 Tax=Rhodococcus qingshengii TaxID=334542 RepID=UPI002112E560|nr:MFS transporter [Rhodococcus qingshengii]MDT9664909.1 MFS transporter [Rhodococcus qingshengii]UUE28724.1 MFS transporter [Rhodococcus qingshengii]
MTATKSSRRWWVLGILTLSQLMVVLDVTIVNIALPAAQAELGFADEGRHWLVTGYALAFGSLLLIGGRLSDFFGQRRMLVLGLIGFALASALGGFATSFETLLAARLLQGVFGAVLAPAALSLVSVTFEDRRSRIRAFSAFGAVSSAGGAVGLLLGGVLTEYLSWHWSMFVNLPIAGVALAGVWLIAKDTVVDRNGLDLPGALTSVAGVVAVVVSLGNAEQGGWMDVWTIAPMAAGLALLVAFVIIERRTANPLLPLRVITDRDRGAANIAGLLVNGGLFGVFLFSTYFLTDGLGYSPIATGLSFVPVVLGIIVTSVLVGSRFAARFGPRYLIATGAVLAGVGLVMLTETDANSDFTRDLLPGLIVYGLGLGVVFGRLQEAATARAERRDIGVASALINASQEVGGATGVALTSSLAAGVAATLVASSPQSATLAMSATVASYHTALWVAVGLHVLAAVVSLLLFRSGTIDVDPDAEPVIGH